MLSGTDHTRIREGADRYDLCLIGPSRLYESESFRFEEQNLPMELFVPLFAVRVPQYFHPTHFVRRRTRSWKSKLKSVEGDTGFIFT